MALPPFNAEAICPKCGGEEIGIYYSRNRYHCSYDCGNELPWQDREVAHMERKCRRCGYRWIEAPLDAAKGEAV